MFGKKKLIDELLMEVSCWKDREDYNYKRCARLQGELSLIKSVLGRMGYMFVDSYTTMPDQKREEMRKTHELLEKTEATEMWVKRGISETTSG